YHDVAPPFPMSLVANTHLRGKTKIILCCYKANVDGFSATDFHRHWLHGHRRCRRRGHAVMFGRFSPQGYRSTDDYYDTLDAFLFYWPDTDTDAAATAAVVLPKVGGSGAALFDYARAAVRRRRAAHRAAADRRDGGGRCSRGPTPAPAPATSAARGRVSGCRTRSAPPSSSTTRRRSGGPRCPRNAAPTEVPALARASLRRSPALPRAKERKNERENTNEGVEKDGEKIKIKKNSKGRIVLTQLFLSPISPDIIK
ncbi:Os07g0120051, partial [Oryza sativa Japonica Group]